MDRLLLAFALATTADAGSTDPPLSDLDRWPTIQECTDALDFHRRVDRWLDIQIALGGLTPTQATAWREGMALCYAPWRAAYWAQCSQDHPGCSYRRRHLAELRDLLGPLAYDQAVMPPPVPVWLFARIE